MSLPIIPIDKVYLLIANREGIFYRYPRNHKIPKLYKHVTRADQDGELLPDFWASARWSERRKCKSKYVLPAFYMRGLFSATSIISEDESRNPPRCLKTVAIQ